MDDHECYRKLILRQKVNRQISAFHRPLSHYNPVQRARIEDLSFRFRTLDAEITAHVLARGAVRVNGSVLVPTLDRQDFIELDAATLLPRYHSPSDAGSFGKIFRKIYAPPDL